MSARPHGAPAFRTLPVAARIFVIVVVAAGAVCLVVSATQRRFDHWILFVVLLGLAILTSAAKIDLPLGLSQSNLSLSHAINFGRCSR